MRTLFILLVVALAGAPASAQTPSWPADGLTPERVYASPSLSGQVARGVQLSPDGRFVTYLKAAPDNQFKLDLWIVGAKNGAPRLLVRGEAVEPSGQAISDEEKARRERQRTATVSGVIHYEWDESGKQILIPAGGLLYLANVQTGKLTKLDLPTGSLDAKLSPLGRSVSFVRDQNLYVAPIAGSGERAITTDGAGAISYGVAEFVAQEEMDRFAGYWWSPGDKAIAYTRVDNTAVKSVDRLEIGTEGSKVVTQRYPRAGGPNANISLFVQSMAAGTPPVRVDLGPNPDIYLARVAWSQDGADLYVQRQSRNQQELDLLRIDPKTGAATVVVEERQTPWIPLNEHFHPLKNGDFLWGSTRSGAMNLYLYRRDGTLIRPVTTGDFPIGPDGHYSDAPQLAGVDEVRGEVYFVASAETPVERQLYAASYRTPGKLRKITSGHGWWSASMSKSANAFIGDYSDPATPPQTALYDRSGKRLRWIEQNRLDATHPFKPFAHRYPTPEFGVLKAVDGSDLHYVIRKPVGFDASRKYPVILQVYGGPGLQNVTKSWDGTSDFLYLEAGYVLFKLDNRGSSNRSMAFQGQIFKKIGSVEVDDQVTGLDWLRRQPFVDVNNIGLSGWSYGGYMALRMLSDPRTGLKAGAAGAPPTDFREYDTHYTERYMGMPQIEQAAYDASAALPRLDRIKGRLLLLQGMADDNVLFSNSIAVMADMQARGVPFDLMLYPGQRHGMDGEKRRLHLARTYLQFFARQLGGAEPPGVVR